MLEDFNGKEFGIQHRQQISENELYIIIFKWVGGVQHGRHIDRDYFYTESVTIPNMASSSIYTHKQNGTIDSVS